MKKNRINSIYSVYIKDYTRKDNESDIRHERLEKIKRLFGIKVYHRQYEYDCDDHEPPKKVGYKK